MTIAIDTRAVAEQYLDWVRAEIPKLPSPPCLATVIAKQAKADCVQYRDMIHKDAARLGVRALRVEADSEHNLLSELGRINQAPEVHGIVVLYPLGWPRPDTEIMDRVSPVKDIEGLHSINLGYLIKYKRFLDPAHEVKCVVPATAKAVVKTLLHHPEIRIEGSFAAIVNNSMRVGKPLGLMLENLGATVVKCYDRTRRTDLEACVRRADILVTAVPDPSFRVEPGWIKEGAAVIDVSYQGNVDPAALRPKAAFVSSADNSIGRMTRAMMFVNLIYCAKRVLVPL